MDGLPPNWECRFDLQTGKHYFVNLLTKTTQWEDPRKSFRVPLHVSSESIPLQPLHGSPYHVYPASNYPIQRAFQNPPSGVPSVSNSPQFPSRRHQMEMSPMARSTPQTPRLSQTGSRIGNGLHETSFMQEMDTEAVVSKINTMFPTVSDIHIRMLLKKYHNREAVVISALQVEKHPLTTPGPYTPPPARNFHVAATAAVAATALQMTPSSSIKDRSSRTASPIPRPASGASGTFSVATMGTHGASYGSPRFEGGFRMSPKPHSSPKMKLRYVKGLFPKAEETIILDTLISVDNNVQKASDKLVEMGYNKRDMISANKIALKKKEDEKKEERERILLATPRPVRIKTIEEKKKLKAQLFAQFKEVPEKIVVMALESVEYSEERAVQILKIVVQEDSKSADEAAEKLEAAHEGDEKIDGGLSRTSSSASKSPQMGTLKASESQATTAILNSTISAPSSPSTHLAVAGTQSSNSQLLVPSEEEFIESPALSIISSASDDGQKRSKAQNLKNSPVIPDAKLLSKTINQDAEYENKDENSAEAVEEELKRKEIFKTFQLLPPAKGPDTLLRRGPNDKLLLADYLTWNGANPDLNFGSKILARGSDPALLTDRTYTPRGAKSELCKGSSKLAKGSIYSQHTRTDVICS